MEELEIILPPDEFDKYTRRGYFTIRRNHEFWAGTWAHQVIEHDLMRPLKCQGGLTHGRGITESTLAHYIHSFPGCLEMCNTMEEFFELMSQTTEQAKVDKTFAEAKISRKARINSLSVIHNTVTINDKVVPVSENQLFMRTVCIMKSDTEKAEYFKYELSPQSPTLFDGLHMRKTDKSAFTTLFKKVSPEENMAVDSPTFVIDGGYKLHAATTTWPRLANYGQICGMYVKHITNNYPSAVVARRAMRRSCPDIVIGEQTMVTNSQEYFLNNENNKGHLIVMLKLRLVVADIRVVQSKDDTDVLIVTTALDIELSGNPAILVGTDTDLLVILIYRNRFNGNVKMLHPSTNETSAKLYDIAAIQKDTGDM
ncbi:hypothetical protein PR048_005055 [Dryococelus australis]|uniref:Uncharacterized protein n=1 Tax=Dryococelus australis TaxID=614101 RepID=A0ABQ9I760_9NEOP|nr:hypothetical protein PR048_005055 [Dryococelus australis]